MTSTICLRVTSVGSYETCTKPTPPCTSSIPGSARMASIRVFRSSTDIMPSTCKSILTSGTVGLGVGAGRRVAGVPTVDTGSGVTVGKALKVAIAIGVALTEVELGALLPGDIVELGAAVPPGEACAAHPAKINNA